ncbi:MULTISPECIES: acetyl-CoA carboxylase biotin carboxyl carrier protein [Candidatus Ichthyocystis]|uniref:Biotin carboxyl carrier protein of acetyl-CoA carboxylase n=1 Tax=Candidatus Ichthyocystis hellenicum TaxID=1561003 RepID=A0A0S4M0H2_9BURK|nr:MULTISPECIES: acetyl-CoA carboxylase biotin carboxyl carrier protein [Ichthyocystis]CUT17315.1 acetyl-CoA carboxylase biotin carboxyl carrier protein [Candidatus Ichthyocystis hellenicum]
MDLKKLKKLIDMVESSAIAELEITEGEEKIRIVKIPPLQNQLVSIPANLSSRDYVVSANPPVTRDLSSAPELDVEVVQDFIIRSPMVGTFYRSPAPGQPPFVSVGASVKAGDVLCILEAMKLLNEIEAECSGVIKSIFVEDGEPVEFNQPLFSLC